MGTYPEMEAIVEEGFESITIETWLQVIPQILARMHSPSFAVRRLILRLLSAVGKKHPQV
jgi:serine/threonine-protein kinase mTOR